MYICIYDIIIIPYRRFSSTRANVCRWYTNTNTRTYLYNVYIKILYYVHNLMLHIQRHNHHYNLISIRYLYVLRTHAKHVPTFVYYTFIIVYCIA